MPITVTITADTPDQYRQFLDALMGAKEARQVGMVRELAMAYGQQTEAAPADPAAETNEPKAEPTVEKPKRPRAAAKTEPTIPATAEAYEAALGEPSPGVETDQGGAPSPTPAAAEPADAATQSTSAGANADDVGQDIAVYRTRLQARLRELALAPGSGGREVVSEVLTKVNGSLAGAMTCPQENLPALEAEIEARFTALKAA